MDNGNTAEADRFVWETQPAAAAFVRRLLDECVQNCEAVRRLRERMRQETGTRLVDWVDHFSLPAGSVATAELESSGFAIHEEAGHGQVARHADGLFPAIVLDGAAVRRVAIKVESVVDYLAAHGLFETPINGPPLARFRSARVAAENDTELWVVERHGDRGFDPPECAAADKADALLRHSEALRLRRRTFANDADGFEHTLRLIDAANSELGVDRACDLFFAAERAYWMSRNRAGRVQKARQDRLGLGWANQDHHTYRSSREHFAALVRVLERMGFVCRERFYAGAEAGWGAQVLEQPRCGVTIFADVDLLPEEVTGDFAHEGLEPRAALGTIGLWRQLHGEAMLQAGLHHLEAQFDFDAAREQLMREGVETMAPFTDFEHLRQAFTTGEMWPIDPERLAAAVEGGFVSTSQADQFARDGALGSHLEILERNDGYKGFNQTGISEIIAKTDPRTVVES